MKLGDACDRDRGRRGCMPLRTEVERDITGNMHEERHAVRNRGRRKGTPENRGRTRDTSLGTEVGRETLPWEQR